MTRARRISLLVACGALLVAGAVRATAQPHEAWQREAGPVASAGGFVENRGQVIDTRGAARPDILYTLRAPAAEFHLRRDGFTHVLRDSTHAHRVDVRFAAGTSMQTVTAADAIGHASAYYREGRMATGVHAWRTVTYHDVQPGIDLVVRAARDGAKVDIVVHPGARISDFALVYAGADRIRIAEAGDLVIETARGTITEHRPLSYTAPSLPADGTLPPGARIVPSAWQLTGDTVRIAIEDPRAAATSDLLVIDPGIVWSTYAGGSDEDWSYGVGTNAAGDVYIAGATRSGNFPVHLGLQPTSGGDWDAFITKYSAAGVRLWSTFLGGQGEEYAHGIAVDAAGAAVICGWTSSANFPVLNATQPASGGDRDAFVAKIGANGALVWSTYYGGSGEDRALGIDVDAAGDIAIAGWTFSANFPSLLAHQPALAGYSDLFVSKFTAAGAPLWSTYLGGGADDEAWDVASGPAGVVAVVGRTRSSNFPLLNPSQSIYGGDNEVVITRFLGSGVLQWSTFLGGTAADIGRGISMDPTGTVFVTGMTTSGDFPAGNGWQRTKGLFGDAFVAKYLPNGGNAWTTFLGGFGADAGNDVHALAGGDVLVTGSTGSYDLPLRNAHQRELFGDEGFVARFNAGGTLTWCTFLGANANEGGSGITWSNDNNAIVTGTTNSTDFPVLGAQQPLYGGGSWDAFVTKLGECTIDATAQALGPTHLCERMTVTLEASAGAGYLYQWLYKGMAIPGAESRTFVAPDSGAYSVQVRNSMGCVSTSNVILVSKSTPQADAGRTIIVCPGARAQLRGQAFGGRAPYAVRWSPGSLTSDSTIFDPFVTVATSREFILTITDSTGCTVSDTMRVLVDSVRIKALPADTICPGTGASLSVDVLNGVPPYSYDWTPALSVSAPSARTTIASPTRTTTFHIRVTDAIGCTAVDSVRVVVRSFEVETTPDTLICHGDAMRVHTVVTGGKPPFTYRWFPQYEISGDDTPAPTVRPLQSTQYTVQVTDALGCLVESSVRVAVRPQLSAGVMPRGPVLLCAGDSVTLTALPVFRSYLWSTGDTTASIIAHRDDRYICTVRNEDGCTGRDTIFVHVAPAPAPVVLVGGSTRLCDGDSVTLEVQEGFLAHRWSTGDTTRRIVVRASGSYWVDVTSTDGCTERSATTRITVVPAPSAAVSGPTLVCADAVAEYQAPQQSNVSYTWTVVGGTAVLGLGTPTVRVQWGRGPVGSVSLRMAVDSTGCVATARIEVAMDSLARPEISPRGPVMICQGSERVIDAGDGFASYLWNTGESTRSISVSRAGRYLVRVETAAGCAGYDSVDVVVIPTPAPQIVASRRALCGIDSVVLGLDAAFEQYLWSTGDTTATVVVRAAGSYHAWVRSPDGCEGVSDTLVVRDAAPPILRLEGDLVACAERTLVYVAVASSGMVHEWEVFGGTLLDSDPQDTVRIRWIVPGSGLVRVRITDPATGCTAVASLQVQVAAPGHVSIAMSAPSPLCAGDSVTLTADDGFTAYAWSTGDTSRSIVVRSTQRIALTAWDAFGCPAHADTIDLLFGPQPRVALDGSTTACLAGVVRYSIETGIGLRRIVRVVGGALLVETADSLTVRWDAIGDGFIEVSVTDSASGCSGTSLLRVRVDTALSPVITIIGSALLCEGDSVRLDAGAGFLAHTWSTGATTRMITVSRAGSYGVTVRDATGCSGTSQPVDIVVHARPQPAIVGASIFCSGDTVLLRAAAVHASYRWSTGDTTSSIQVSRAGTYALSVTDMFGCIGAAPPHVLTEIPPPPLPVVSLNQGVLQSDSTGLLQWFLDGAPLGGATASRLVPVQSGSYSVRVMNASGCTRMSDALVVTLDRRPFVALAVPPLAAAPGERVVLPVRRTAGDAVDALQAGTFHVRVRVPADLLAPVEGTPTGIIQGMHRVLTLTSAQVRGDTLVHAVFLATLGAAQSGAILLDSAWWSDRSVDVSLAGGHITLSVCEEGGARLFDATGSIRFVSVAPNPFNASADIAIEVIERSRTTLDVVDHLGRRVARLLDAEIEPGIHAITFDARALPSGVYTGVLHAGGIIRTHMLLLLK